MDGTPHHVDSFAANASAPLLSPEERLVCADIARQDLYFFARYMFLQRRGFPWLRSDHHQLICDALMRVYRGECRRLIINIPPRYSKTELAVVNFIAWCLGNVPDAEFIYTSYSAKIATKFSYHCRELVKHPSYQAIFPYTTVSNESKAKDDWATTRGGTVYATGCEGTITGFGAGKAHDGFGGAIIVDDPLKVSDARSANALLKAVEFFTETLETRLNNPMKTPIIVIMQRLNEADLSGFLLKEGGASGNGEEWEHLCLPAIQVDPKTNEERSLWPAKHPLDKLLEMRRAKPYSFSGQYQQSPVTPEGNVFKPGELRLIPALPTDARITWVRGWDFAGSVPEPGKDPDWSVGLKLGKHGPRGKESYVIAHVERDRAGPEGTRKQVKQTAKLDGRRVFIDIPEDPGQAGKAQVLDYTKMLRGYRVFSSPERGDKVSRAEPFAAQVNVGNVSVVQGEWNQKLFDEMRMFPNGLHDDQVDGGSRAFNRLLTVRGGLNISDTAVERIS